MIKAFNSKKGSQENQRAVRRRKNKKKIEKGLGQVMYENGEGY